MKTIRILLLTALTILAFTSAASAHYDPNIGRWMSRDPIGENGGLNLYEYVGNNPTNQIDPLGLDKLTLKYDLTDDSNYVHADEDKSFVAYLQNLVHVRPFVSGKGKHFSSVFDNAKTKVGKYDPEGKDCNCIKLLVIVTHGSGGNISPADRSEFIQAMGGRNQKERQLNFEAQQGVKALQKFAALLCKDGKVQFTACDAGADPRLQIQLEKAGIPVIY